jgi:hypothetical protein
MTGQRGPASDRWPGPGGAVEEAIVELVELVRAAADRLDGVEPHIARDLRLRAASLAVKGVEGLLEATP